MKLIYCYIHHFRNIEKQEVSLSPVWDVHYDNGKLQIQPKEADPSLEYVFGDLRAHDLHVVVGKTGSGKTNFLQLLGMDEHLRYQSAKAGDAYVLLYAMNTAGRFAAEVVGLEIKGVTDVLASRGNLSDLTCIGFDFDCEKQVASNVNRVGPSDFEETHIINTFDRFAFADCPYDDDRIEGVQYSGGWLPRMVIQFGNSSVSLEYESLKSYLKVFAEGNVKHKTSLCIRSNNWQNKIPVYVSDQILEKEYWTYYDKRIERNYKPEGTPKSRFMHDFMVDFALYLRKWAATVDRNFPEKYFPYTGRIYDLGIKNPRILPDGWNISLLKRIDWLCQYIDYHTDEMTSNKGLLWQIGSDIKDIIEALQKMDDKYFTDDTFTIPVAEIDIQEDSPMSVLFECIDQYRPDTVGVFTHCLLPYTWTFISSGEYQYAKVWSILEEYAVKVKIMAQGSSFKDAITPNLIVLMDEPESYMHPELCRCFLKNLFELISKRSEGSSLQVILTTHSPFMLSDVLSSQVIKMDIDEQGLCKIAQGGRETFAANVHTIMADSFFLDYTIGEYAREFLTEKLAMLKDYVQRKDTLTEEEWTKVRQLREFMPKIGDEMIRYCFESLLKKLDHGNIALR